MLARLGASSWRNAVDTVLAELDDYPRLMIVHGRDQDRAIVQRLLREHGVKTAYVLAEQPRLGDTVLHKFQECARQSDAAVVLFTPDDYAAVVSRASGEPDAKSFTLLGRSN